MMRPPPWPAILLLGPTGSGKSPLGDRMESRGLEGRPCAHFDFGRWMRRADADPVFAASVALSDDEQATIRRVLREGALLESKAFGIAEKILDGYVASLAVAEDAWLVMNGLPRHVGQARFLADRLRVEMVVLLDCTPEVVIERIRRDTGGDRSGRPDDDPESVRRRLETYRARTEPLAAHYAARGASVLRLPVGADATPAGAMRDLVALAARA